MGKSNSKSEKAEIKKMKCFIEENMRLGASEDYAKGYRQAVKDFKRKMLLACHHFQVTSATPKGINTCLPAELKEEKIKCQISDNTPGKKFFAGSKNLANMTARPANV